VKERQVTQDLGAPVTWAGFYEPPRLVKLVESTHASTVVNEQLHRSLSFGHGEGMPLGRPYFLTTEGGAFIGRVASEYTRLVQAIVDLARQDTELLEFFDTGPEMAADVRDSSPALDRIDLCRVDTMPRPHGGLSILETNANCPGCLSSGQISRAWRMHCSEINDQFVALPYEDITWFASWFVKSLASTEACMADSGFAYDLAEHEPRPDPDLRIYPTATEIDSFGYGWFAQRNPLTASGSGSLDDAGATDSLPPEYVEATNQCLPARTESVGYAEYSEMYSAFVNAQNESINRIFGDSRYLTLQTQWSGCVAAQGFEIATISDAQIGASELPGGSAGEAAIAQARADYGCRQQVGLEEMYYSLRDEFPQAWLDENPTALPDLQSYIAEMVARAKVIVG
jgi:hypothetical protein